MRNAIKFAAFIGLNIAGLIFVYAGHEAAPHMKWPATEVEYIAAHLLVIGALCMILGAAFSLSIKGRV